MGTWSEYIHGMKEKWIGQRVLFEGLKYTVRDVDMNGALMIDKPATFTSLTAVGENMIIPIEEAPKEESGWLFDELYNLCVRKNWYTCGTNEEYEQMLNLSRCGAGREMDNIVIRDIYLHSDPEVEYEEVYGEVKKIYQQAKELFCFKEEENGQFSMSSGSTGDYCEQLTLDMVEEWMAVAR